MYHTRVVRQLHGLPHQYSVGWPLGSLAIRGATPPLSPIHTSTPSPALSFPSLSSPSPWQMAASQPATPAKACELKVIPSRFEELPEPPWRGRSGGGGWGGLHPPASQARGHLAGTLWNEHSAANHCRRCHHGRHCAERNRTENEQTSGCLSADLCLHLCGKRTEMLWTYSLYMNHGSEVSPSILLQFLIEITEIVK